MAEKKPFTGMACEEFTQLASAGCEGKLGFRDRLRMLWHQIECVYCRRFFTQLKKIRSVLRRGHEKPMPATMKAELEKKLRNPR